MLSMRPPPYTGCKALIDDTQADAQLRTRCQVLPAVAASTGGGARAPLTVSWLRYFLKEDKWGRVETGTAADLEKMGSGLGSLFSPDSSGASVVLHARPHFAHCASPLLALGAGLARLSVKMAPCQVCNHEKKTKVLKLRWFVQALEGHEGRKLAEKPGIGDTKVDYGALARSGGAKMLPGTLSGRMVSPSPMIRQAFGLERMFVNRQLSILDTGDMTVRHRGACETSSNQHLYLNLVVWPRPCWTRCS